MCPSTQCSFLTAEIDSVHHDVTVTSRRLQPDSCFDASHVSCHRRSLDYSLGYALFVMLFLLSFLGIVARIQASLLFNVQVRRRRQHSFAFLMSLLSYSCCPGSPRPGLWHLSCCCTFANRTLVDDQRLWSTPVLVLPSAVRQVAEAGATAGQLCADCCGTVRSAAELLRKPLTFARPPW